MKALSVGLPGRLKSSVTPWTNARRSNSLLINSGAVVEADRFGIAELVRDPLERRNDIDAAEALPRLDRRRQPREGVDDGQHADLAAVEQLIMRNVHRPDLIRCCRWRSTIAQLRLDPPFRRFVAQLQALLALEPTK